MPQFSFKLQKMEMSDWLGIQVLLTAGMLLLAGSLWKRYWGRVDLHSVGVGLVMLAIAVRLMVPTVALASETIYARFLSNHYQEATQTLTNIDEELRQVDPTGPTNDSPAAGSQGYREVRRWLTDACRTDSRRHFPGSPRDRAVR